MSRLRRLFQQAKEAAEAHLPADVLEGGRRVGRRVLDRTPNGLREAIDALWAPSAPTTRVPEFRDTATAPGMDAAPPVPHSRTTNPPTRREGSPSGPAGYSPEDTPTVVVQATPNEQEAVRLIRGVFAEIGVEIREIDLTLDPRTARQIAQTTGVMVPPYVFISGRFWGSHHDVISLHADGDLAKIVAGRLDELSEAARRSGRLPESFSDAMSPENIVDRLRRGHILTLDGLDCWFEADKTGEESLFYQAEIHPGTELEGLAQEIAFRVEMEGLEATWRLAPQIKLH